MSKTHTNAEELEAALALFLNLDSTIFLFMECLVLQSGLTLLKKMSVNHTVKVMLPLMATKDFPRMTIGLLNTTLSNMVNIKLNLLIFRSFGYFCEC